MRRKRRNHSPSFKAKMSALLGDRTVAQLVAQMDENPFQIQDWKRMGLAWESRPLVRYEAQTGWFEDNPSH